MDRGSEFWAPPAIWRGASVAVLGGGPSIRDLDLARIERLWRSGWKVIAINSLGLFAPWADLLYFQDNSWRETHQELVEAWGGLAVTASRQAKAALPDKVKRIAFDMRPDFPAPGSERIRYGRSSGHMAVSIAIAMGAARIVLFGFDMRQVGGRSHGHDDYAKIEEAAVYSNSFIPSFDGWDAAAKARGVEILNATSGSALAEFAGVTLEELEAESR